MRATLRAVAALGVLGLAAHATLHAQRPQERHGFWIGFGWGYGSAAVSCDSCSGSGRVGALSGFLKMGGTPSAHLLLGGETNGWVHSAGRGTEARGNASFAAYYYPTPASGLFLKGGVGFSTYSMRGGDVDWSGGGFGVLLGAGLDARVGRNVSLTPVINFFTGSLGTVDAPGYVGAGDYSHNVLQFALGITFH